MEFEIDDFQLDGRIVLITGVVYGIGFEITKSLAEAGATIVFNNLSPGSVEQDLENYQATGIEVRGCVCNVADGKQVQAMVAQVKGEVGSINILINNARVIKRIPVVEMSTEEFRQMIDVDLNVPFIMAKAVTPDMIEKGRSKITSICSMMSELGHETVSAYAATKGGLKILTRNIASEYRQYNTQRNGIGPGYIETPQTAPLREPGHPFSEFILGRTPANRRGTPADLTSPAVFLASNASGFVNGHILYVDGGTLACIGKQPQ